MPHCIRKLHFGREGYLQNASKIMQMHQMESNNNTKLIFGDRKKNYIMYQRLCRGIKWIPAIIPQVLI